MSSRTLLSALRPFLGRLIRPSVAAAILVAGSLGIAGQSDALNLQQTGKWTPPVTWAERAVHLMLLRSHESTYHSKVLWWLGTGHHEAML